MVEEITSLYRLQETLCFLSHIISIIVRVRTNQKLNIFILIFEINVIHIFRETDLTAGEDAEDIREISFPILCLL